MSPARTYLGDVAMPLIDPREIHSDAVVGVVSDADGVQSVVVHRIRKR